jgi:hypothetical protein
MIEPAYLAQLRRTMRAEHTITLVQIEQLVPNWWPTIDDLAEQLEMLPDTLHRTISKLERRGLLRRVSRSGGGGTWIWWVKRSAHDLPDDTYAPRWVLREVVGGRRRDIIVGQERAFAAAYGLPCNTVRSFLGGYRKVLAKRWQLVSSPLDLQRLS